MPLLDSEEGEKEMEKVDGCQRGINIASNQIHSCGRGSVSSDREGEFTESCDKTDGQQQKDEDSGFSFSLDLGPSILDDVLQVMDKRHN